MTATLARDTAAVEPSPGVRRGAQAGSRWRTIAAWSVAALLGLAVWEAMSFASGQWVPSLSEVGESLIKVLTSGTTITEGFITMRRVALVTVASVFAGVLIGLAAGFWWPVRAFLRPILVIGLAVPDLVYIIMAVLVLGATESSGLIAVTLAIVPLVANVVIGAVADRDVRLDEMARTYRFSTFDYARHVVLEQLKPALAAALKTGFAFSWKLVVLMETITMPNGIGSRIYEGFRFLRPQDMIAYAVVFIVVMKVVEWAIVKPLSTVRS
jgi:NitT/TauT family transport system permease protein